MTETKAEVEWTPPFCANNENVLKCPKCGEESVYVREQETYLDCNDVEAYCGECHALLTVYSSVEITFSDPECAHSDCGLPGASCGCPVQAATPRHFGTEFDVDEPAEAPAVDSGVGEGS